LKLASLPHIEVFHRTIEIVTAVHLKHQITGWTDSHFFRLRVYRVERGVGGQCPPSCCNELCAGVEACHDQPERLNVPVVGSAVAADDRNARRHRPNQMASDTFGERKIIS
jgi:hypothetical protein